jgi:hypothetical protein
MAHKQVLFRSAAREKILRGATQLADAIRVTLYHFPLIRTGMPNRATRWK